jgi:hypothetical protein
MTTRPVSTITLPANVTFDISVDAGGNISLQPWASDTARGFDRDPHFKSLMRGLPDNILMSQRPGHDITSDCTFDTHSWHQHAS